MVQDLFFQRSKKHYTRFRIRYNGNDSGDIKHDSELNNIQNDNTGNVEINLEEARLAKRNVFTDIAVKHLRFLNH